MAKGNQAGTQGEGPKKSLADFAKASTGRASGKYFLSKEQLEEIRQLIDQFGGVFEVPLKDFIDYTGSTATSKNPYQVGVSFERVIAETLGASDIRVTGSGKLDDAKHPAKLKFQKAKPEEKKTEGK
jgi:hypothetical protein